MAGSRNQQKSRKEKVIEGLPMIRRHVAGIDLGGEKHWVCAPTADGSEREVTEFGCNDVGVDEDGGLAEGT